MQNAHESREADHWPITTSSTHGWAPEEQSADGRFVNRKHEQEGSSDNVSKASFPASKYPSAKEGGCAKEAWNFCGIEDDGPDIAELQTARLVHVHARGGREADQWPIRRSIVSRLDPSAQHVPVETVELIMQ